MKKCMFLYILEKACRAFSFKVFRYSFSEAIPIFFNCLKVFLPRPNAIKFSPVIGVGLNL